MGLELATVLHSSYSLVYECACACIPYTNGLSVTYRTQEGARFPPFPLPIGLRVEPKLPHGRDRRQGLETVLLVLGLPGHDVVPPEVHHPVGRGVAHLAVVEELVGLEDAVAPFPGLDAVALLVHPAVAVRVLDGQGTQAHVVGRTAEVDGLLWVGGAGAGEGCVMGARTTLEPPLFMWTGMGAMK